jgi:hypothetical protein
LFESLVLHYSDVVVVVAVVVVVVVADKIAHDCGEMY